MNCSVLDPDFRQDDRPSTTTNYHYISMLFDTHAHVNFTAFKDDYKKVLDDCLAQGVCVINVGSQYSTSKRAMDIANQYESGVYAVVGLHPVHLFSMHVDEEESSFQTREEIFDYQKYRALAINPKVVGIGECGLEYFHLPAGEEAEIKKKQREVFIEQINLASDVGKTLMIHSRDAYDDVYEIITDRIKDLRAVVIHSFIGSAEQARKFVELGCLISFNGIITYKPSKEKKPGMSDPGLLQAVKYVPLDRILLETDCPYLAPVPVRGTRNVPVNVKYVAQKISEVKGIGVKEVEEQTTMNARKAFNI